MPGSNIRFESTYQKSNEELTLDKDLLQQWRSRIRSAKQAMRHHVEDWTENANLLRGHSQDVISSRLESFGDDREEYIHVNTFYSVAKALIPSLYFGNPEYSGRAKRPGDWEKAKKWGPIVQNRIEEGQFGKKMDRLIPDALCASRAIIKLGWIMKLEAEALGADPQQYQAGYVELSETKHVEREMALAEEMMMSRVSPSSFLTDEEGMDETEWAWVAERVWKHPADLVQDSKYVNTEHYGVSEQMSEMSEIVDRTDRDDLHFDSSSWENDTKGSHVAIYEVWDKRNGKVLTFGMSGDGFLRVIDWPYEHRILRRQFPYEVLDLTISIPDDPHPIPLFSAIRQLAKEKSDLRTLRLDYLRRSLPSLGVLKSGVDSEDLDTLESAKIGKIIHTKGDPNGTFKAIAWPQLGSGADAAEMLVDQDIIEITGVSKTARGSSTGVTATEASIVDARQGSAEGHMRRKIQDFMRNVGRKVLAMESQFMMEGEMRHVIVTGRTAARSLVRPGKPPFIQYSSDDIPEEVEVDIDVTSMQPQDPSIKKKQAMDLFNILAPFSDLAMPGAAIDGISLLKGVLDAFDVKDMEELLPGLISRRAPQNPYDEWQLLLSGGDIAVSPNDNHMEHLIEHESVMQMPEFQMLPPEVQQIWMMHGQKHQMYFQMMQPAPQGGPNDKNGGGDQKSNKVDAGQYNRSSPSQSSLMRGASGGGSGMGV